MGKGVILKEREGLFNLNPWRFFPASIFLLGRAVAGSEILPFFALCLGSPDFPRIMSLVFTTERERFKTPPWAEDYPRKSPLNNSFLLAGPIVQRVLAGLRQLLGEIVPSMKSRIPFCN